MPSASVAFLDEVFKASSSILNALLTVLNERIFHNGTERSNIPLLSIIAASNELPRQGELNALYDRFLLRKQFDYVANDKLTSLLSSRQISEALTPLTKQQLEQIQQQAEQVVLPDDILELFAEIVRQHRDLFKDDLNESLSDRRLIKAMGLLRVSAATNDRSYVDLSDLLVLKDCLWNEPDNANKVKQLLVTNLDAHAKQLMMESSKADPKPEAIKPGAAKAISNSSHAEEPNTRSYNLEPKRINGLQGSGTIKQPYLIHNLQEFSRLHKPELSSAKVYIKQMTDIDLSSQTAWPDIAFNGHYDGSGYSLTFPNKFICTAKNSNSVFTVLDDATVVDLKLVNTCLARGGNNSYFRKCQTNTELIWGDLNATQVYHCQADNQLINGSVFSSRLYHSQSKKDLIAGSIKESILKWCEADIIADKLVDSELFACYSKNEFVKYDIENSTLEYCQSSGFLARDILDSRIYSFDATASSVKESHVVKSKFLTDGSRRFTDCDISDSIISGDRGDLSFTKGVFDRVFVHLTAEKNYLLTLNVNGSVINNSIFFTQKSRKNSSGNRIGNPASCTNNAYFGDWPGKSDANGPDGYTLSADTFNQYYFEHDLNWDFNQVWHWDAEANLPVLRHVGLPSKDEVETSQPDPLASVQAEPENLLAKLIHNNLWL